VVVSREGAEEPDALELLMGVSDADLDALVETLLADNVEDEAEVPFLARRAPGVFAMTVDEMTVSAADVKKLRQQTGAGMMDCKKALKENGGDFEKSTEVRKGGSRAALCSFDWGSRVLIGTPQRAASFSASPLELPLTPPPSPPPLPP
jgi:hypothetical protein